MKRDYKRIKRRNVLYACVIFIGIFLDQLSKGLVVANMKLHESIPIVKDVLHLTYVHNKGAAFGMLADQRWVFLIISTVTIVSVGLYLFLGFCDSVVNGLSLALILSGGVGNMFDRLILGYVVDFVDFTLIDFAIFNVADAFVCIGAALLCISLIAETRRDLKESREKKR